MKIGYALFDQAFDTGDGNYWTWADTGLQPEALRHFYTEYASKHRPPKPNGLTQDDIWGGIVRAENNVVVYRYFNGDKDDIGRPQRFVLLTAWIPVSQGKTLNVFSAILTSSPVFQHVNENAKQIPVPKPSESNRAAANVVGIASKELVSLCNQVSNELPSYKTLHVKIEYVQGQFKTLPFEGEKNPAYRPPATIGGSHRKQTRPNLPPEKMANHIKAEYEKLLEENKQLKQDNVTLRRTRAWVILLLPILFLLGMIASLFLAAIL